MEQVPGEVLAQAMFGALDGRHVQGVEAFLDDASLLHVSGASGLAGDYQGRDAILGLLGRMAELTGGTLRCGASRATPGPPGMVILEGSVVAAREGRTLETSAKVTTKVDSGALREIWISHRDQPAFDDFWS